MKRKSNESQNIVNLDVAPATSSQLADCPWKQPQAITPILPPVQSFNAEALVPAPFLEYVLRTAKDLQVRNEAVAAMMLGALSGAVMRRALIRPKPNSDWIVYAILWTVLIQSSGSMKSPIFNAALRALEMLQSEAFRQYLRELETYRLVLREDPDTPKPICPRFILNEATFAALHEVLRDNLAGVLLARDELMGLLMALRMRGRELDLQFLLEMWSGTRGFSTDRISRGLVHIEKGGIAIMGTIQPPLMQRLVTAAVERGDFADGFLPRFQLMVWPDESPDWSYTDELNDPAAFESVLVVFRRAVQMSADEPREYRFDIDAQALFEQYLERLEYRIRRQETENIMKEVLGKYRSLMPAIALLLQFSEDLDVTAIPLHRAWRAWRWCDFLESHARRAYACVLGGTEHPAKTLADRIKAGALGTQFSVREVYLHDWTGLTTPDTVRDTLQELENAGWVRRVPQIPGSRGGRPSELFEVNPQVYRA
jgi:putative DNA primase/helicase